MKSPTGRKWLLASLLALNAVIIALVFVGLSQLHVRSKREAEIRSQNIASAVALHLSSEVSKIDLSLRTVAAELEQHIRWGRTARDHVIQALIARQKAALPNAEAWSVTDAAGVIVFHEGGGVIPSFRASDRDYFQELASGQASGLVVSKPIKSRLSGNWVVVLARAIRDAEGRFNGIVAVPLPVKSLNRMLTGFQRFLRRGQRFDVPEECRASMDSWMAASNTTAMFTHEVLEAVTDDGPVVEGARVYDAYRQWVRFNEGQVRELSRPKFYDALRKLGFVTRNYGGRQVFKGVRLRANEAIEDFLG